MDKAVAPKADFGHSAVVQFLCSRRLGDGEGEVLEAGRLAVRWFEQEVGPESHQALTAETNLAWRALRLATRPAIVESAQGRRISGMRIGPAAHDLVTSSRMLRHEAVSSVCIWRRPPPISCGTAFRRF